MSAAQKKIRLPSSLLSRLTRVEVKKHVVFHVLDENYTEISNEAIIYRISRKNTIASKLPLLLWAPFVPFEGIFIEAGNEARCIEVSIYTIPAYEKYFLWIPAAIARYIRYRASESPVNVYIFKDTLLSAYSLKDVHQLCYWIASLRNRRYFSKFKYIIRYMYGDEPDVGVLCNLAKVVNDTGKLSCRVFNDYLVFSDGKTIKISKSTKKGRTVVNWKTFMLFSNHLTVKGVFPTLYRKLMLPYLKKDGSKPEPLFLPKIMRKTGFGDLADKAEKLVIKLYPK